MRQRTPLAMMQPLESRMFLSVAPSTTVDTNPTIIADRAQLAADQQTLRTDYQAGEAKIVADHKAIADELAKLRASDANLATELKPLTDKLAADRQAGYTQLAAERP